MSWSISATGKPAAVLRKARQEFSRYKCAEPEETIKGKAQDILEEALREFPESSAVQVSASGSQTSISGGAFINSLSIEIKPIFGFVE